MTNSNFMVRSELQELVTVLDTLDALRSEELSNISFGDIPVYDANGVLGVIRFYGGEARFVPGANPGYEYGL